MHDQLNGIGFEPRAARAKGYRIINRTVLYLLTGALGIAVVVVGNQLYQERQKSTGVEISIGDHGISIEKK